MKASSALVLLIGVVLLAGCAGAPDTSGESTPEPEETANPTATLTATPTATATATPSATPTSTPTPASTPTSDDGTFTVTITEVVDGDTVDIRHENGILDTVRLLGIDTPEVHVAVDPAEWEGIPDTEAGRECLEDWGSQASAFVATRIEGETVTLELDPAADRRGSFGRLLGYLIVDGENLNYQLVSEGYARVYDSTFSQSERFYTAEAAAQDAQRGAWECRSVTEPTPTPTPSDEGELAVSQIHADASGNDHESLNDEYIVFRNSGSESLDLSGWRVQDEADHTYWFPDGFTLDAGDSVTLYTGSGVDSSSELYWGSSSAIWNNGGDTVFAYDDDVNLVLEESYS